MQNVLALEGKIILSCIELFVVTNHRKHKHNLIYNLPCYITNNKKQVQSLAKTMVHTEIYRNILEDHNDKLRFRVPLQNK
jgi:hypothetical protein